MIAIGLDYGTTNSLVAVYQDRMSSRKLAKIHKESSVHDGDVYIHSPKRLLNDINPNNVDVLSHYIAECICKLFTELKYKYAELDYSDVHLAVTVPDAFKDEQCLFLKKSIARASIGFFGDAIDENNIDIIPEPVAAALYCSYCSKGSLKQTSYLLVSDMGGGTTDLAVVKIENTNGELCFKVICTEHDSALGGTDIDSSLMRYIHEYYKLEDVVQEDLIKACRYLKERLSYVEHESIVLLHTKDSTPYTRNGKRLELDLERKTLENVIRNTSVSSGQLFIESFSALLVKLKHAFGEYLVNTEGYDKSGIDKVIDEKTVILPVGGSSRIPVIQSQLQNVFGNSRIFTLNTENDSLLDDSTKFDSVCRGAAIYSAYMSGIIPYFYRIRIENRTLHRISVRYTGNRVFTCVEKTMPDGVYKNVFTPKILSEDGKSFSLNKLELYQGGSGEFIDNDTALFKSIELPDHIYAMHKSVDDIKVSLNTFILKGRVSKIEIIVPGGCGEKGDYIKTIEL